MIIITKDVETARSLKIKIEDLYPQQLIFQHSNRLAIPSLKVLDFTDDRIINVLSTHHAAVQSSRLYHPEDTIIKTQHSIIGDGQLTIMAGPDSIESAQHVHLMAEEVANGGATILRGGSFKPRTSPYSFQGVGESGLVDHRQAADAFNLDMVTEVLDPRDVEVVDKYTDIFQVGTRNMQNFALLKALGAKRKPVVLKRGMSASIDELLQAAEYIAAGGNTQIILMERGIRSFDNKYTRNTLDVGAVAVLKQLTHYPVMIDASHAAGNRDLVASLTLAGVAAGADGFMLEIHDEPEKALVDADQAITPATMRQIIKKAQAVSQIIRGI